MAMKTILKKVSKIGLGMGVFATIAAGATYILTSDRKQENAENESVIVEEVKEEELNNVTDLDEVRAQGE